MQKKLFITLISFHGYITGHPELGRDADTGGQVTYVLDLAKALAQQSRVRLVHLITRRITDDKPCYSEVIEPLGESGKCFIVRVDCADNKYIKKENLWPVIPEFVDNCVKMSVQLAGGQPNVIHSHYADAGYIAYLWSMRCNIPFIHTGHSLGRDKLKFLMSIGVDREEAMKKYNFSQRFEAEELVLKKAKLIITSTYAEIQTQYSQYNNFNTNAFVCIPPSIDLKDFKVPKEELCEVPPFVQKEVFRFLKNPNLPIILAVSRANPKKNIIGLIHAYANSDLKNQANLVLILGTREKLKQIKDKESYKTLKQVLFLIDDYDLYDHVAYPKNHTKQDLGDLYRYTAKSRGIFVNVAYFEPFGLTLLEASYFGIPLVATKNGGPTDIIKLLNNGILVNPEKTGKIAEAIGSILNDGSLWERYSKNGLKNISYYSWESHAVQYIRHIDHLLSHKKEDRLVKNKNKNIQSYYV